MTQISPLKSHSSWFSIALLRCFILKWKDLRYRDCPHRNQFILATRNSKIPWSASLVSFGEAMVHRSKSSCTRSERNITEFQRGGSWLSRAFLSTPCPIQMRVLWTGFESPRECTKGKHVRSPFLYCFIQTSLKQSSGSTFSFTTFEFTGSDPMTKSEKKNYYKRN